MIELKMLINEKDLSNETGLSHEELWDNGFNLDDWDVCFVSKRQLKHFNANWLLCRMESYCCGYEEVPYKDKFYYLVYHA